MGSPKAFFSNALLVMGILFLGGFAAFELKSITIDPIIPALAAFCIATTALLDRIGQQELE
jgi:CHASE2 domain-containing sensor protein